MVGSRGVEMRQPPPAVTLGTIFNCHYQQGLWGLVAVASGERLPPL